MPGRVGVEGGEEDQQVRHFLAGDPKGVFGSGGYDDGVVGADGLGLAVHADLKGAVEDDDKLVNGVGMERRAGARLGGVDAEGAGDALLVARDVPLAVARTPGHLGDLGMVYDGHCLLSTGRGTGAPGPGQLIVLPVIVPHIPPPANPRAIASGRLQSLGVHPTGHRLSREGGNPGMLLVRNVAG